MRTLNKTLSLVLVLVMVLGFFGVATAATKFTDATTIQYAEAVNVMTGVGAIAGYEDGSFKPAGAVTRAEAAKLVTYAVLGASVAKNLPVAATAFTDIDANTKSWAGASIAYLVSKGIINGRDAKTFDPAGKVTAYEIAKMMLCAMGYGVNGEYTGSSWQLNVAIDAAKLGLFAGTKATDFAAAATREECALYAFNGIVFNNQVVWDAAKKLYVSSEDTNDIALGTIAHQIYGLLYSSGVPTTGGKLEKATTTANAYGQPTSVWKYDGDTISTVTDKPVLTYTQEFVPATAYKALKDLGYKFGTTFASSTNGHVDAAVTSATFGAATAEISGNGTVTEFYVTDKTVTKMVTYTTNFLLVDSYTEDVASTAVDERSIVFTDGVHTYAAGYKANGFDAVFTAVKALKDAGKDAGALVVINAGADAATLPVIGVSLPTYADLKITSTKGATSFTADSKTYEYAAGNAAWFAVPENELNAGNTYTVYFDANGFAVYAKAVAEILNVGIVLKGGQSTDGFDITYQAKMLGADAAATTRAVADIDADNNGSYETAASVTNIDGIQYSVVSYKLGTGADKDKYLLTQKADYAAGTTTITSGKVSFTDNGAAHTYYADANTVFVIETISAADGSASYKAYTGIKNVPSIASCDGITVYNESGTYVDLVFVTDAHAAVAASEKISFVAVDSNLITTATGSYYDAGIISGKALTDIKQIKLSPAAAATMVGANNYLITAYTEEDGIVTSVTLYDNSGDYHYVATATTGAALNGNITLGGAAFTYTDDCIVWTLDSSKTVLTEKFVPKTVSQIGTDPNDVVFFVAKDTTNVVSAIYVIKVANDTVGVTITVGAPVAAKDDTLKTVNVAAAATGTTLLTQVAPATGCTARITDAAGTTKANATGLVTGDKLVITSPDGTKTITYTITVNS
ncbi:MAG: S-layer homology domain-containing protein [Clostridia bacterium]|nr:S-layer homology domain-containing protein [Clostridia bacterium]